MPIEPASVPAAPAALASLAQTGLDEAEAARRLAADGPNLLPGHMPRTGLAIVLGVLFEPMFLMLLAAGGIYFLLGDRGEALFLLSFVGVVIGIALLQERRTQRALEALRELSAPRAQVIRGGRTLRVAGRDVVRGDLLVLHEGDRVPADARLVDGALAADESLLTGESVPVEKRVEAAGEGAMLHASTVVTRGLGLARVEAIGAATAVGRIGESLAATTEPPSALQRDSRRLIRRLGAAALALAAALVLLNYAWGGRPLLESLLSGIALAMAILPEEIPLILTVFLALGAWRISRQAVLTRRIAAVEALGAVTVLAVDKTGTLTQNRMAVVELFAGDATFRAPLPPASSRAARVARNDGSVSAASSDDRDANARANANANADADADGGGESELPERFHRLVEFAMLATPADPFDPMETAIQAFGHGALAGTEHVHDALAPEFEYPLSSGMLAMTRVFPGSDRTRHLLATKGAPEAVADLCHLDAAARAALHAQVESMAERGLRVLAVASGRWQRAMGAADAWPASQHDFDFEFLGLVGLADPPRPEVPAAIAQCRAAGVRVLMLTGDHPATARAIATQVGLDGRGEVLTGAEIETLDDAALATRLAHTDLCARLQPAHKLRLVQALRAAGEVVAMTGDGVNDAPALKAADVGVAMGERGTDVAREAASLVLLDDSFARIVAAIRQGRRIYDNIDTATRFVFAVHVPVIVLALAPALLGWPVLLLPVHIVLLELLIDPACSVVFEAEPEAPDVMRRPPRPAGASPFARGNLLRGVVQGAGLAVLLLAGYAALRATGVADDEARAVVFLGLLADVLWLTLANRTRVPASAGPRVAAAAGSTAADATGADAAAGTAAASPWVARMALAIGLLSVAVVTLPPLRETMGLGLPGGTALAALALLSAAGWGWLRLPGVRARG